MQLRSVGTCVVAIAVNPRPVFLQLRSIGTGVFAIAIWISVFAIAVCQTVRTGVVFQLCFAIPVNRDFGFVQGSV